MTGLHDPNHKIRFRKDPDTGETRPYTEPNIEFEVERLSDGKIKVEKKYFYLDPMDTDKAEILIKAALRRAGITREDQLNDISAAFCSTMEPTEEHLQFQSKFPIYVGGHHLGILKICYEMAWYWLGDSWLDDQVAIAMRGGLNGNEQALSAVQGKVFDDPNQILIVAGGDTRLIHAIYLFDGQNRYHIGVRLFDVLSGVVIVTMDASRYTHPLRDAIIMQNVERTFEETTFSNLLGIQPGSGA